MTETALAPVAPVESLPPKLERFNAALTLPMTEEELALQKQLLDALQDGAGTKPSDLAKAAKAPIDAVRQMMLRPEFLEKVQEIVKRQSYFELLAALPNLGKIARSKQARDAIAAYRAIAGTAQVLRSGQGIEDGAQLVVQFNHMLMHAGKAVTQHKQHRITVEGAE